MNAIPQEIREYIEKGIIPLYAQFDKAHQEDHVRKVIDASLRLSKFYETDIRMVYVIAACHDIGLCEGRERHNLVSARMLLEDKFWKNWFSQEQMEIMAQAIEDHRASNSHPPRSIYGRIVAEADRLIEPSEILLRTVQYGLSHYPHLDKEEQWSRFCEHLHEKYADGGYLKLWIQESDNSLKLNELRKIIEDKHQLRCRFDEIYRIEK